MLLTILLAILLTTLLTTPLTTLFTILLYSTPYFCVCIVETFIFLSPSSQRKLFSNNTEHIRGES